MSDTLAVIPTFLTDGRDVELVRDCLQSLRETEPDLEVLVVDDGSPEPDLVDAVEGLGIEGVELHRKPDNTGFARTVNIGCRRALEEGRDVVLVNADVTFIDRGWLRVMQAANTELGPAAIVGALLLYPSGVIQHAAIYFSLITRQFDHRFKFGPANLPEALEPTVAPVTGALMMIRHDTLATVGLLDEAFFMGWEDVDLCLRTFLAGKHCVYQPRVRAYHHESVFRGKPSPRLADWQSKSFFYLMQKYRNQSFAGLVPSF